MKFKHYQSGAIPVIVLVALAVSALAGGYLGFQLGDGTFFSFGVGLGIVIIGFPILYSHYETFKKSLNKITAKKNEHT
jgi:asparagine N-glycosylation enzyme membrane subunit Stt3